MNRRLRWIPAVVATVILAGCSLPSFSKNEEVTQTDTKDADKTIIPSVQIDEQYYRTLMPYKESPIRGLIVSNINSKYDIKEVESGLLRISQQSFDPDDYYFQEGQYLDKETVTSWLARSNQAKGGLNPSDKGLTPTERAKQAPIYLAHIVEQNYLKTTGENKVKLAGVSVGLALNSVYYYQKEEYGATYEEEIPQAQLEAEGKKIAEKIVQRMRKMEGLANVPITVGLFKQQSHGAIIPGSYFASATASGSKTTLGKWENVAEEYKKFPMAGTPEDKYREINDNVTSFKDDVDEYFSNRTNVIATGFYKDNDIKSLKIDIPIKFYSTTEVIGFTQYVATLVTSQFPKDLLVEINVTSSNGSEALIEKEANEDEPKVHIYND